MPLFLTIDHFVPLVGATFRLPDVPGVSLVLAQAAPLASMKTGGVLPGITPRVPFDLIFTGPKTPVLPQQIYRMETDAAEPMEMFIVPIGPEEGGMLYQAVFT
ncbi:MAG: hypothetical protein K1Y01_08625 [Vicinamibacteria bacterium]|nr:hypothetical protein [Vicinamibacteria bacterium]